MKKQSSIEWLAWKFATTDIEEFKDNFNHIIEQAKQIEKQQIKNEREEAYNNGYANGQKDAYTN